MILDTNGELFPEGRYKFRVTEIPEEVEIKSYIAYQWAFDADTDEGPMPYRERFMVWLVAPLVRGLGFKEIAPGKFDYEATQALGRECMATIKHVTLEKGPSAGKTVARMTEIAPVAVAKGTAKGTTRPEVRAAMSAQAPSGKVDADIDF